jgi:uncharacterized protein
MSEELPKKSRRGFASMDPEKRRQIASMGGKSVPAEKRSFSADPALASKAGRIGGQRVSAEKRSFTKDRTLATKAGGIGGRASHRSFKPKQNG